MNTESSNNRQEDIFTEDARMAAINSHLDELDKIAGDVQMLGSSEAINEIVGRLVLVHTSLYFLV